MKNRNFVEERITRKLIIVLLNAGFNLSVFSEGELDLDASTDKNAIFDAMTACDDIQVIVGGAVKKAVINLCYGNGYDLISDYSEILTAVLEPVFGYIEKQKSIFGR